VLDAAARGGAVLGAADQAGRSRIQPEEAARQARRALAAIAATVGGAATEVAGEGDGWVAVALVADLAGRTLRAVVALDRGAAAAARRAPARASEHHHEQQPPWGHATADHASIIHYNRARVAEHDPDRTGSIETATLASQGGAVASSPRSLEAGTRFEHYVVEGPLGGGAMGVVVAAQDTRLDRRVAIKLLRPGDREQPFDEAARLRLLREAQAMAKLSHPNVIVVHEVGSFDDQVYIAMEHVDGQTLSAWLRAPRTWREVLGVFLQAGRGLAAAHHAGLIHRDFKPDNVLLGADGRARVGDFGLVATSDGEDDRAPSDHAPLSVMLTRTGALMGTPRYMAPEQHARGPVTAAADQFAFCVSLFEGLYGEHPFGGDTYGELVTRITAGDVRPPPRDTRVPGWVRDVVVRGLAVDPRARHPSMTALLAALGRDPEARRRAIWTFGLAGALVVGLAVVAFVLLRGGRGGALCEGAEDRLAGVWDHAVADAVARAFAATKRPYAADTAGRVARLLDRYTGELTAMRTEACEATRVRGDQSDALMDLRMTCLDRRMQRVGALVRVFATGTDPEIVDHAVRAVEALPAVADCRDADALRAAVPPPRDPAARARVDALRARLDEAESLHGAGRWPAARAIAESAIVEARALDYAPALGETLWALGVGRRETGDYDAAQAAFTEAAQVGARAHDDTRVAESLIGILQVVGAKQMHYREALAMLPAVDAAVTRAGDPPLLRAYMNEQVGEVYGLAENNGEAYAHLTAALELLEKVEGRQHERAAHVIDSIGLRLVLEGKYAEAREYHQEALSILEAVLGPEHPAVARSLYHIGSALQDVGRYEEARPYYERALRIDRAALGPDHPNNAYSLNALGDLARVLGDLPTARTDLEQALAIWEKSLGPEHEFLTFPLRNLATVLDEQGHHDAALPLLQRALAIGEKAVGKDHSDVAEVVYALAQHDLLVGQLDESRRLHDRATAIWERQGKDHPYVAWGLTGSGEVELAAHRPERAIGLLERALRIREAEHGDEAELARTRFALARALWDSGRDRSRAVQLATAARGELVAAGRAGERKLPALDAWLASHRS